MGQNVSKVLSSPPLTLRDCLSNGQIDPSRYYVYRRRLDVCMKGNNRDDDNKRRKRKRQDMQIQQSVKRTRSRSVKRHRLIVRDKDGSLREIKPEDTLWYLLYVAYPPMSKRMHKIFRLRFRLPYASFMTLSNDISIHPIFARWTRCDATGSSPSNIKLLILGCLRYMGRAWTLDDVYEANGISINTNRDFMLCFIEYGSTVLYRKWVLDPTLNRDVSEQERIFQQAGFDGCIGSSDATHIPMLKCPHWAQIAHKGFKLSVPARTYNATVDHSRRILGSTMGHPGTWNDKTLILFDELICNVKNGKIPNDYTFTLKERNERGQIVEALYEGVWFMVDNGYLSWSCTVPPDSNGTTYDVIRFSEWLESMRKDVECVFGIMKGRFCILRYGLRFHSLAACDKMWLTCCSLHNMLLEVDGLDKNWENGVRSDWERMHSNSIRNLPFAIQRLNRHIESQSDESETETLEEQDEIDESMTTSQLCKKYTVGGKRLVSKMPLKLFKKCLVDNFDIRFKDNDIVWPSRIRKPNY